MLRRRAAFVCDVHLGAKASQGARFRAWLADNTADVIYLVGDIFDGLHAIRSPGLIETLRQIAAAPRIVYVPGNHDAFFRRFLGRYGHVEICVRTTHEALDGRRLLITHGDEFDRALRGPLPWLGAVADHYGRQILPASAMRAATRAVNKVATGGRAILNERLAAAARDHDGVITGHFHDPGVRALPGGALHYDAGDWISHCTALVEDRYGELRFERG